MIIGTAGHIDHGKTTLVKALTGVDADRLKEEKARGITLDLGYAYAPLADGSLGFIDVPGHEKLIHNMLAGATGIDFALLVIAADDGPMPQTREHLEMHRTARPPRGAVALTKVDMLTVERLAEAKTKSDAAGRHGTGRRPLFPLSAKSGEGHRRTAPHLEAAAAATSSRGNPSARPLPPGHRPLLHLSGAGTVVTGTAFAGKSSKSATR
jgi:selenocysteine-specific elongation factor